MSDKKRKSFVLHIDSLDILDDLDDDQVAGLFRAIKAYQNGEEIEIDKMTKMVFLPFKNQFNRDNEKYKETCEKRAKSGALGGKAKVANASKGKQMLENQATVANLADSDSKNKSDSKSESNSEKENKNTITSAKLPKFSQDDLDCAKWIYELLLKLNPSHKKPNFESWANEVRKIVNIDNRTYQEISDLMLWVNQDVFWQSNILSPKKLREKWDQLILAKNRNSGGSSVTMTNMATVEHFKKLAEIEDGNDYAQLGQN